MPFERVASGAPVPFQRLAVLSQFSNPFGKLCCFFSHALDLSSSCSYFSNARIRYSRAACSFSPTFQILLTCVLLFAQVLCKSFSSGFGTGCSFASSALVRIVQFASFFTCDNPFGVVCFPFLQCSCLSRSFLLFSFLFGMHLPRLSGLLFAHAPVHFRAPCSQFLNWYNSFRQACSFLSNRWCLSNGFSNSGDLLLCLKGSSPFLPVAVAPLSHRFCRCPRSLSGMSLLFSPMH